MKVGDLVYLNFNEILMNAEFLVFAHVLSVYKHGIDIIVLSGPHIGDRHYLPYNCNDIVVVSEI